MLKLSGMRVFPIFFILFLGFVAVLPICSQRSVFKEKLRITLPDPSDRIYLTSFNSDGSKLLVVNEKSAQVWSTETGKLLVRFEGFLPFDRRPEFKWQPGGSKVLQYDSNPYKTSDAFLWDAETGKRIATLTERRGIITAEWNSRGDRILTVGNWRTGGAYGLSRFTYSVRNENGSALRTTTERTDQVHSILFSVTGDKIIISHKGKEGQKSIRMYDVESDDLIRGFDQEISKVDVFTYAIFAGESPDGRVLCGQIKLSKGVACWRVEDNGGVTTFNFLDTKQTGDTYLVGFARDSSKIALLRSRPRKIEIADSTTGEVMFSMDIKHKVQRLSMQLGADKPSYGSIWSPSGRYFVVTDIEKEVSLWDVEKKQLISNRPAMWDSDYDWFVGTLPTDFEKFSFNERNEFLLSVTARTAKVWNPSDGQLLHEVVETNTKSSLGTFQRYIAQWSPGGKYLLTAAEQNKTLVLWAVND